MPYPDEAPTLLDQATLAAENLSTGPHSQYHADHSADIVALANKSGYKRIHASEWDVFPDDDPRFVSAAANTFAFNANEVAETDPCIVIFEPTTYSMVGFGITRNGHFIEGATTSFHATIFDNTHATANTLSFVTDADEFSERLQGCGARGITLLQSGDGTGSAIYIRHMTHGTFDRVLIENYNGVNGAAINASSFADTNFIGCDFHACGSFDNSNKAEIYFHNDDDNDLWNVDQIRFIGCRFEQHGDRIAHFNIGSGAGANMTVNKIMFIGCKFESRELSGSNDANQSQFLFSTALGIQFTNCEFTLTDKNVAHTLQTVFRLIGSASMSMSNVWFNFGSGADPKCFTNFFVLNGANQLLALSNVWINSGNSTAFPTNVISCTNSPHVALECCGFTPTQGDAKVLADFLTGTTDVGGIVA